MNLAATTSISDIMTLSILVIVATILGTAMRPASGNVRRLSKTPAGSVALQVDPDLAHRVVRSHYRSLRGMLIALMPAVALIIFMTTCSLLRDRGFVIFWLPVTLACCIIGLVAWWSYRIHDRLILTALQRAKKKVGSMSNTTKNKKQNKSCEATGDNVVLGFQAFIIADPVL